MRRRLSAWHQVVVLAAWLLAGGAVVNVGVAWVAAADPTGPFGGGRKYHNGVSGWRKELSPEEWPDTPAEGSPAMENSMIFSDWSQTIFVGSSDLLPGSTFEPGISGVAIQRTTTMIVTDCGWPLRSLTQTSVQPADATIEPFRAGIPFAVGSRNVSLPIKPLPLGFAVNTVFFAVALSLLAAGRTALVRARRRRKGLCVACAYSRSGLGVDAPCPECGTTPSNVPIR